MKNIRKIKILILILNLFLLNIITTTRAQVSFPSYEVNNLNISSGTYNYSQPSSISSSNSSISGSADVEFKSGERILFKPSYNVSGLTGSGNFHAYIEKPAFDVVIMEPTTNPGHVGKHEKIEVGLKLSDEITNLINRYIYYKNEPISGINPFDPDQISVEATFTSPSNINSTIYGFYYKEFLRNYYANLNDYKWDTVHTNYPWRIRFAPDEIGEWKMSVNISVNYNGTTNYSVNNFVFTCDNSSNKGYLKIGSSARNLQLSETTETFFAIGENLPDATYTCWTNVPKSYFEYEHYLNELASVGGNYVRHFLTDSGHPVEWRADLSSNQILTNYNWGGGDQFFPPNKGESNAWEFDQFLSLAKSLGIYIHLTLDGHASYNGTQWSDGWNPYTSINNTRLEFFQNNNNSWNYYKKRLRYIVARWGYSTNIACWELFNEVDQIGESTNQSDNYSYKECLNDDCSEFNLTPNPTFQNAVGIWQNEMAYYLKTFDKKHLVTTSYAGKPNSYDNSFNSPFIDFTSLHRYENKNDGPGNNHYVKDVNSNYRYNDLKELWETYGKPYIIGESGMGAVGNLDAPAYCCDVSFHNSIWSSAFMGGFGASLNWPRGPLHSYFSLSQIDGCVGSTNPYPNITTDYYKQIKALTSFVHQFINFETDHFTPQQEMSEPNEQIECFTIVNESKAKAFGWMHQRDYYWLKLGNYYPCLQEFGASTSGPGIVDSDEKLVVTGLIALKNYKINLYRTPYDGSPTSWYSEEPDDLTNLAGTLKKGYGLDFQQAYHDFAYIIERSNNKNEKEIKLFYDTLSCPIDTIYFNAVIKEDYKGVNTYSWNFGNGQTSNKYHPKVFYNKPGDYLITVIIKDTIGNFDTLQQWEHVPDCSSYFKEQNEVNDNSKIMDTFINIYPNPSNGNMTVSYELVEDKTGMFEIYDMLGRKLYTNSLYSGKNTFAITDETFSEGVYIYKAFVGNELITTDKIVVIK